MAVQTVAEAWNLYENTVLSEKKERYKKNYIAIWKNYLSPVLSKKNISDISKYDYITVKKNLELKELSPQTIHHALSLLRRVLYNAIEYEEYSGIIPSFNKIMPKFDNKRMRFLSKQEVKKLLSCMEKYKNWHEISLFALNTGMRRGEIFSLKWNDVDFSNRLIKVVDTKSIKNRFIPMNDMIFSLLKDLSKKNG